MCCMFNYRIVSMYYALNVYFNCIHKNLILMNVFVLEIKLKLLNKILLIVLGRNMN